MGFGGALIWTGLAYNLKKRYPDKNVILLYEKSWRDFILLKSPSEHARVIKPDGYALYDIGIQSGKAGAFEAVEWESEKAIFLLMLKYFKSVVKVETEAGWKWVLLQGKKNA